MKFSSLGIVVLTFLIAGLAGRVAAFPVDGDQTVLPAGTELNEDSLTNPREVFHSEALHGHKSYLINLGDLFSAPLRFSAAWHGRRASAAVPATSTEAATPE